MDCWVILAFDKCWNGPVYYEASDLYYSCLVSLLACILQEKWSPSHSIGRISIGPVGQWGPAFSLSILTVPAFSSHSAILLPDNLPNTRHSWPKKKHSPLIFVLLLLQTGSLYFCVLNTPKSPPPPPFGQAESIFFFSSWVEVSFSLETLSLQLACHFLIPQD